MNYFIMWAVFGAAAGTLAKGKNRNIVLWVFIGLLTGPIAVLILALIKPGIGPEQDYK